jgi:predicted acylesterase/phospholipase RssA
VGREAHPANSVENDPNQTSVLDFCGRKAVAASISIPFFFAPTAIESRSMVDGGLMSNFPTWLFDAERAAYPPFTRTYGFTLVDAAPDLAPWA